MFGDAVQLSHDVSHRAVGCARGQYGVVLQVVGADCGRRVGSGVTPLSGSPGATRSIPSLPLEKMLLERMLLPVPDCTVDAGLGIERDLVAQVRGDPADGVAAGGTADDHAIDFIAQRRQSR